MREGALLEAVIGVKCPLAPAGGGLGIQPVRWEHHEDEVGVELLLLFSHAADIVVWFHTCGGDILVRPEAAGAWLRPQRHRGFALISAATGHDVISRPRFVSVAR